MVRNVGGCSGGGGGELIVSHGGRWRSAGWVSERVRQGWMSEYSGVASEMVRGVRLRRRRDLDSKTVRRVGWRAGRDTVVCHSPRVRTGEHGAVGESQATPVGEAELQCGAVCFVRRTFG